jgi:hypothetical protein
MGMQFDFLEHWHRPARRSVDRARGRYEVGAHCLCDRMQTSDSLTLYTV